MDFVELFFITKDGGASGCRSGSGKRGAELLK